MRHIEYALSIGSVWDEINQELSTLATKYWQRKTGAVREFRVMAIEKVGVEFVTYDDNGIPDFVTILWETLGMTR